MILSNQQNKAAKLIKDWYLHFNIKIKPYFVLGGVAGSGKSSIISYVLNELGNPIHEIATYTGMAACVLIRKGNETAKTIHRLIYNTKAIEDKETKKTIILTELKPKEELSHIKLIVIDECWMVPDNLIKDLMYFGIPILFAGDPGQLDPIYGKNSLEPDFFLDEPHRQALDSPILLLANYARNKEWNKIRVGNYGDSVRVFSEDSFHESCITDSDQIICGKNATVNRLNKFYRLNYLGFKDLFIRNNEKLVCLKNNWSVYNNYNNINLVNGLIGNAVDIRIKPKAGIYMINFKIFSGEFEDVLVDKFEFEGKELDDFTQLMRIPYEDQGLKFNLFQYGYAITTHKSQGSEFPYVTLFFEPLRKDIAHKMLYTGITRASEKLDIIL